MVRARTGRSENVSAEMKFGDITYRCAESIAQQWSQHFQKLYTEEAQPQYDSDFYNVINSEVEELKMRNTEAEVYK